MAEQTQRVERSRAALIAAAADALVAGDGDFELQDVARRAGVSVGLPYHHFGSKAGLIAAVVGQFYEQVHATVVLSDVATRDWAEREQLRLSRLIRFLYRNDLATVVISRLARDPEVTAREAEYWTRLVELAASNIVKGQARGQLPPELNPMLVSAMICGGLRSAIGQALTARPRPKQDELTRQLWNFIIGGLQADASRLT
ncbi:TetR/AcrR family transcriptional regulator [Elongatibacter sediminis]|uniref:TetR/AcrR family transcriptional regulator n=1 Tax=Elongatibacter sediminis TaxID=3119006 RepID=A0AAW9RHW6_9GAMM